MKVTAAIEIDRETTSFIAHVEGDASLHYGLIEFSDFTSDVDLTPDEQDMAEEALREVVRYTGLYLLPEQEPDARRPH
jgi:hypothetical protein